MKYTTDNDRPPLHSNTNNDINQTKLTKANKKWNPVLSWSYLHHYLRSCSSLRKSLSGSALCFVEDRFVTAMWQYRRSGLTYNHISIFQAYSCVFRLSSTMKGTDNSNAKGIKLLLCVFGHTCLPLLLNLDLLSSISWELCYQTSV